MELELHAKSSRARPWSSMVRSWKTRRGDSGTRGIDAATARHMAELGVKVVVTGRLLVREVNRKGGCAASFRADLSPPDAPSAPPELGP